MDFKTKIKSTVETGTAPFDIASTTAITNLNADLLDGRHAEEFAAKVDSLYYVEGNTSGTVGFWTGSIPGLTTYYDGLSIAYKVGIAGASTTRLNINGLGDIVVRRNTGNLTSHLPVGTVAVFIYTTISSVPYFVWADYDTNTSTYDRTYWGNNITAGAAIYDYKLLAQGLDGKFYPLTLETGTRTTKTISTQEFKINTPILYYATTTDVAANATLSNVYSEYPVTTLNYTANQASWTSQFPIYLVGVVQANGNIKLDNTTYTNFMTQTLPTTQDGKVYILLGYMYSTTSMRLFQYHPMYEYRDGALRVYVPIHSHGSITDDGKIGSTADLIVKTTTSGLLTTLAAGTTSQYLRGDGSWAAAYTHPSGFTNQPTTALTGANVVSQITVNAEGHVSGIVSRSLTAANIGAAATSHNQAWSTITSTPTTVAGYGIIDAVYATDGVATGSLTEPYSRIIQAAVAPSGTVASTPFPDLWLDTASVPFKLKFWDGQIWQAINTWQ